MQTEHPLLVQAGESFALRMKAMQSMADVNRASVECCLDPLSGFNSNDPADAALVASSVVYGIASLRFLRDALVLAALDLETASDCIEAERFTANQMRQR